MPTKSKDSGKTRTIKFFGTADKVDMRPAVGFNVDDDSDEAMKFVFYRVGTRSTDKDAQLIAARQRQQGTEMTEDQAATLLTTDNRVWGFADITGQAGSEGSLFAAGVLSEANLEGITAGIERLQNPPLAALGTPETGYPIATPDNPTGDQKAEE